MYWDDNHMCKPLSLIRVTLLSLLILTAVVHAQEDNSCEESSNKNVMKLLEKGRDKKKYEFEERIKFIRKALEEEPDFVAVNYEMGMMNISLAKGNGTSFKPAEKYLQKVVDQCPDYNYYAYYYLGLIAYGSDEYEKAYKNLDKFLKNPPDKAKEEEYKKAEDLTKRAKFFDQVYKNKVPFEPRPVKDVCTFEDEFLPMLSPDNEFLYYTKRYMKQGKDVLYPKQVEEFMVAKRNGDKFDKGNSMEPPFNRGDNYGGVTFSLDNEELFITICNPNKRGIVNCDIFTSRWNRDKWTDLVNLGPNVNTADGWEAQPSLSADGKTLYFASARADSKGMDIYKTERQADGSWGAAVNMGPTVNTAGNEKTPFIHSDSQTLYFSSDGWPGIGGYDIFYLRMGEENNWKEPKNIGFPINTDEDEIGFFVSTDGKLGYFATNKLKGKGAGGYDIFSFDLYKEARPEKVLFLRGKVEDAAGSLPTETSIEVKTLNSNKTTKIDVDSVSGKYAAVIAVKPDEDAVFTVKKKGYAFSSTLIKSGDTTVGRPVNINKVIAQVEEGKSYNINDINYRTNSAELTADSKQVLKQFADYLIENENLKIEIRGHTDNVGSSSVNMALSSDRAFTVMDFLIQQGVPKSRLSFKGFGDTKPVASNSNEEGRSKNRRTEFLIVKM
jgi:outer membrane protein OmpA-like peptidoglycan-associated protein/tetratricopeptide (TPR) repeat protein